MIDKLSGWDILSDVETIKLVDWLSALKERVSESFKTFGPWNEKDKNTQDCDAEFMRSRLQERRDA